MTAQPGELAESEAGTQQCEHVIPPEHRTVGEQPASFLRGVGPPFGLPENLVGVDLPLGRRNLTQRVRGDGAFDLGELEDAEQDRAAAIGLS